MKFILIVALAYINVSAYAQTSEVDKQFRQFMRYYQKEKFKKAAPYFETLMNSSFTFDKVFYQSGMLMYDYLYAESRNTSEQTHYQWMMDTLNTVLGKSMEEVYKDRYEVAGEIVVNGEVEPVYGGRGGYDQAPEYPTGLGGFLSDVAEEIRLSPVLSHYKKEQKGFVAFVVNGDGRIINIEIMKGFTPEIDQEVIKIIGAMPD
ncbi:MAG: hypothetical protein RIG62_31615 [Cyclobacteriaceae bacterium]